jgi:hypothetical protein
MAKVTKDLVSKPKARARMTRFIDAVIKEIESTSPPLRARKKFGKRASV